VIQEAARAYMYRIKAREAQETGSKLSAGRGNWCSLEFTVGDAGFVTLSIVPPASEPTSSAQVTLVTGKIVHKPSEKGMPRRTKAFFAKLDKDKDNRVTLTELQSGFEKEFKGQLRPHAKDAIVELFEAHAKEDAVGKSLKPGSFNRFYAEILFRHFDANNNGTLQLEEAQEALKFLYPTKDGAKPDVNVAFPDSAKTESGEFALPKGWFFMTYQAVE